MALIQSGAGPTLWTVDPASNAGRVTLYDASGNPVTTMQVSLGNAAGKSNVMKPALLATTSNAAGQVVLTYTVTAGKTLYLLGLSWSCRLTNMAGTVTFFGSVSLESPTGTALVTDDLSGAGFSQEVVYGFEEPVPIPAGTVVRVLVNPSANTNMTWRTNLFGYEK